MSQAPAIPPALEVVREPRRAGTLLSPVRLDILGRAAEPRSSTEIAASLGLPRQRVNYHVRELAREGFLVAAGRRKKRNLYEQRWRRAATSFVLAPELLGPVQPDWRRVEDRMSAEYLVALAARVQSEVGRAYADATAQQKRLSTLSIDVDLRFESAEQREGFARALQDAVTRVVAQHASSDQLTDGSPGTGRRYRLVFGCHPVPAGEAR
jgi:biotin operon repressor